jgi:hypothetical protein
MKIKFRRQYQNMLTLNKSFPSSDIRITANTAQKNAPNSEILYDTFTSWLFITALTHRQVK